jgi:hypothetical protein
MPTSLAREPCSLEPELDSRARLVCVWGPLLFEPEDGHSMFLQNAGLSELHGVTTQKTTLAILRVFPTQICCFKTKFCRYKGT